MKVNLIPNKLIKRVETLELLLLTVVVLLLLLLLLSVVARDVVGGGGGHRSIFAFVLVLFI